MREPASGTFDVTVAPGEDVQAAVDACPPDGSVLLLPGTHDGPLVLTTGKVVHVFGLGRATLRAQTGTVVLSKAATATLDGLVLRREAGGTTNYQHCVWITGGRLRLQACDITSAARMSPCVAIEGGADPVLVACKCVGACAASPQCCPTFSIVRLRRRLNRTPRRRIPSTVGLRPRPPNARPERALLPFLRLCSQNPRWGLNARL